MMIRLLLIVALATAAIAGPGLASTYRVEVTGTPTLVLFPGKVFSLEPERSPHNSAPPLLAENIPEADRPFRELLSLTSGSFIYGPSGFSECQGLLVAACWFRFPFAFFASGPSFDPALNSFRFSVIESTWGMGANGNSFSYGADFHWSFIVGDYFYSQVDGGYAVELTSVEVSAIPAPAALPLLLVSALSFLALKRRRDQMLRG